MNKSPVATNLALWALIALYAAATVLPLFAGRVPVTAIVAAHIIPAALFALLHGAVFYRVHGILVFAIICLVIGNITENLGVRTGFPFGHYYFTDGMGPKLFVVPLLMGPAYMGMGYLAWTLGRLILGPHIGDILTGSRVVTVPLAASFIMVAWDLVIDPTLSTIGHYWIWPQGGAYFGVPATNFFGWFLTNYLIYQAFALYLRRRSPPAVTLPARYWRLAVLFYAVVAAGNVLPALAPPALPTPVVADPAGTQWKVMDINGAAALAAIFIMGAFAMLAWVRGEERRQDGKIGSSHDRVIAKARAYPGSTQNDADHDQEPLAK